jgi:pyruvate kinase
MRRTKIIATIGPASDSSETLTRLVDAGMAVARLNASHSTLEQLDVRISRVREAAAAAASHVAVMLDLPGSKVRLLEAPDAEVAEGEVVLLSAPRDTGTGASTSGPRARERRALVASSGILVGAARLGDVVLVGDGDVELEVISVEEEALQLRATSAGRIAPGRGVTLRGGRLDLPAITQDDERCVAWGLEAGVDWFAQSFVRHPEDVWALRRLVGDARIPIMVKIERGEALEHVAEIIEAADAVMVARGDLALATAPESVPIHQKRIAQTARDAGRPVVVATQMLESMLESKRPTRAEASDVANAVFDAVDAVMLSGETAVGSYPVRAVETMARIASIAEESGFQDLESTPGCGDDGDIPFAVSAAVAEMSQRLDLSAIVTATESGATARAVAAHRPGVRILAVTPHERVARQLAPVWGIEAVVGRAPANADELMDVAAEAALAAGCRPGELIAITAGVALGSPGGTDLVQVRTLE